MRLDLWSGSERSLVAGDDSGIGAGSWLSSLGSLGRWSCGVIGLSCIAIGSLDDTLGIGRNTGRSRHGRSHAGVGLV